MRHGSDWITESPEYQSGEFFRVAGIARRVGKNPSTIRMIADDMVTNGRLEKSEGRWRKRPPVRKLLTRKWDARVLA